VDSGPRVFLQNSCIEDFSFTDCFGCEGRRDIRLESYYPCKGVSEGSEHSEGHARVSTVSRKYQISIVGIAISVLILITLLCRDMRYYSVIQLISYVA
jgi:hypothetical protein